MTDAAARMLERLAQQEESWPPERSTTLPADKPVWRARLTSGAGRRVASARPLVDDPVSLTAAVGAVEQYYLLADALPRFQVSEELAARLVGREAFRGYQPEAPTRLLSADVAETAALPLSRDDRPYLISVASPLAAVNELWSSMGTSAARRAVMARAPEGLVFVARLEAKIAAAAFVSIARSSGARPAAVLHALAVAPWARRRRAARDLIIGCARWAESRTAETLLIDVEAENDAALRLYERLGCRDDGGYVYLTKEKAA